MKVAASIAFLAASASAFAPASTRSVTSALAMADENDELFQSTPPPAAKEMSKALPFVPRPKLLDGTMAGDVGFE